MAITNTQYEKICQFLDAGMDMEAMEAFEAELITNPEMRQRLDFELLVRDGLAFNKAAGEDKSFALLRADQPSAVPDKNTGTKKTRRSLTIWTATGVAASILLVISLVILFKPPATKNTATTHTVLKDSVAVKKQLLPNITASPSNDSNKRIDGPALFARYYAKDKIPETYPLFLADALARYEAGDYTGLQQLNISDIPDTRGSNAAEEKEKVLVLAHYYKGISWLQTGKADKAIPHFDWVIKNKPGNELMAKAEWYLALAFLKENEAGKARDLLKMMIGKPQNNELGGKAKTLFTLLEKEQ